MDETTKWLADNVSTDDGYAGQTYTYNQVQDGLAEMWGSFDEDLKRGLIENQNNLVFKVVGHSRDQRVRKFPTTSGDTAFYLPASAQTKPKPGDVFYIYYDNNVYLDVTVRVTIENECTENCDPPPPLNGGACERERLLRTKS